MSEEMIPLKLCVDLLMENTRTINEFRHFAIPSQGLSILGHFVISDTLSDLRSKVEQAVREMAKGGNHETE